MVTKLVEGCPMPSVTSQRGFSCSTQFLDSGTNLLKLIEILLRLNFGSNRELSIKINKVLVFGRWPEGLREIPDCLFGINAVALTWFSTAFYVRSAVDWALF